MSEREGWVNQEGALRGGVGRTAITYAIRPQAAFVLGIDLGGTKVHVALADLGGEIVEEAIEPTDRAGATGAIAQIARMARSLAAAAGVEHHRIRGAAMGSPGVVDRPPEGSVSRPTFRGSTGWMSGRRCATHSASRSLSRTTSIWRRSASIGVAAAAGGAILSSWQ